MIAPPFDITRCPRRVLDAVSWVEAVELRTDYYESLRIVAWIQTDDALTARRFLDKFYTNRKSGGDAWVCLNDLCYHLTRGAPVELHIGGYFILCGFDFD